MKLHVFAVLAASVAFAACSGSRQEVRDSDAAARGTEAPAESAEQQAEKQTTPLSAQQPAETDMFGDSEALELLRVHFPFDSAELSAESQEVLKRNAEFLRRNPNARIVIEGHTDERGTADYNLALGEKRAKAVRNYLKLLGIDVGRMDTVSYGSEQPLQNESNEDAWSKNRRAQFREL